MKECLTHKYYGITNSTELKSKMFKKIEIILIEQKTNLICPVCGKLEDKLKHIVSVDGNYYSYSTPEEALTVYENWI